MYFGYFATIRKPSPAAFNSFASPIRTCPSMHCRSAFRVKRDEIQWNSLASSPHSCHSCKCFRKLSRNVLRLIRGGTCAGRAAHDRIGQRGTNSGDRIVIELVILLWSSVPIRDVRLVPDFEVPRADLFLAIALYQMLRVFPDQLPPDGIVLGRIIRSLRRWCCPDSEPDIGYTGTSQQDPSA